MPFPRHPFLSYETEGVSLGKNHSPSCRKIRIGLSTRQQHARWFLGALDRALQRTAARPTICPTVDSKRHSFCQGVQKEQRISG